MLLSQLGIKIRCHYKVFVSILVVVDVALAVLCCPYERNIVLQVSILVVVDVALAEHYDIPVYDDEIVSILVVVDVALAANKNQINETVSLVSILVVVDVALAEWQYLLQGI